MEQTLWSRLEQVNEWNVVETEGKSSTLTIPFALVLAEMVKSDQVEIKCSEKVSVK